MQQYNIPVIKTTTTPSNPPAGFLALYFKSDGNLYSLNSSWVETNLSAGGGWAVWGGITGTLSDQLDLQAALNAKQPLLVSGTNIKTVNGQTLVWSGNITISGSISDWDKGDVTVSGAGTVWTIDNGTITIAKLAATGTPNSTTFLRWDNTWAAPWWAAVVTGETENFVGNGVQTAFVLANPPADPDMVWVSGNWVFDQDWALLDYTITGQTVTFNTAPTNGYKIQVKYIRNFGSVLNLWREEVPTGAINSINTVFTLTQTPIASSPSVYINGLRQIVTTDYTITGTTLTFVTAPSTWATLFVKYMY